MALKKSDLYQSLWRSCDELRGGMDASQYKDYILTLLFLKYVSDKAKSDPDYLISVPAGGSFDTILALKNKANIGEGIDVAIGELAAENDLEGVIDVAYFNDPDKMGDGKDMVDRLTKLVAIFEGIDFRGSRAEGDDLLGGAYEYLMRHFASESGKSKGQFYTPAEVSQVVARVVGIGPATRQNETVYDMTCGSGSLLLKAANEAPNGISIYGQEKDVATWALARMNMILHGHATHVLERADTITNPKILDQNGSLRTFDFIVANPPFSVKSWANGISPAYDHYNRFTYGVPPDKNGDYAFLLHALKSLKGNGKAAIILPHGVLFRGNAEARIRRELVKRGYIKGVIGLPPNLFYGTGIPACILVLDKEGAAGRKGIFMVDASKGFQKNGNKNRLRARDVHRIVDVFKNETEIPRYSRFVPHSEIGAERNDYNLNIPRYLDSSPVQDIQDLYAHLHGGIPNRDIDALDSFWDALPSLRKVLFRENTNQMYSDLAIPVEEIPSAISGSTEFLALCDMAQDQIDVWFNAHDKSFRQIDADTVAGELSSRISENLLEAFRPTALIDEYAMYQQLMTFWDEVMRDDVYLVVHDGWTIAAQPRAARIVGRDSNNKPKYEDAHIQFGTGPSARRYVMDLVPPNLVVDRYFREERALLATLNADAAEATAKATEFLEANAIEDGLLWDAVDDKGKITQKSVRDAMLAAQLDGDEEALDALRFMLELMKKEAEAKRLAKEARTALDTITLEKYESLTTSEVQTLVIDDKWHRSMTDRAANELAILADQLLQRIYALGTRYEFTVTDLRAKLAECERIVDNHFRALGVL